MAKGGGKECLAHCRRLDHSIFTFAVSLFASLQLRLCVAFIAAAAGWKSWKRLVAFAEIRHRGWDHHLLARAGLAVDNRDRPGARRRGLIRGFETGTSVTVGLSDGPPAPQQ